MFIVPTFQDVSSRYIIETELNNEVFRLLFDWNARAECWYMDIRNQDDENILTNIKLVPDYVLIRQYSNDDLPKGDFYVADQEDSDEKIITFDNFGIRFNLLFFTEEELGL